MAPTARGGDVYGPLTPGQELTYAITNTVPGLAVFTDYYALGFVDYYDDVDETNENNNIGRRRRFATYESKQQYQICAFPTRSCCGRSADVGCTVRQ